MIQSMERSLARAKLFKPDSALVARRDAEVKAIKNRPGRTFESCVGCPAMIVVRSGTFTMGSPATEAGRNVNEGPQRAVTIAQPFAIGKFEVTRGQYAQFVRETGRAMSTAGCSVVNELATEWSSDPGRNWSNPGFNQDDQHPVVCVSWEDADAYVKWLGAKTGRRYRLPSEAEWEYSARADSTAPFSDAGAGRFYTGAEAAGARRGTERVGSYPANKFGLHDVHGNAFEWVADCWIEGYQGAPGDGRARVTLGCLDHARRGGAWRWSRTSARSAARFYDTKYSRRYDLGFRVAMTLD